MIKAKDYEDQVKHSRLDAAMLALGFSWDGEAYTKKEGGTEKNTVKKVAGGAAPKAKRTINRRRARWAPEFYASIMALGHGQSIDISNEVRTARVNAAEAHDRVYAHSYTRDLHKTHVYRVRRHGTTFVITRI